MNRDFSFDIDFNTKKTETMKVSFSASEKGSTKLTVNEQDEEVDNLTYLGVRVCPVRSNLNELKTHIAEIETKQSDYRKPFYNKNAEY